jgi:hypothetical protein
MAFFSPLKPTIDLLVNGETILSAVNNTTNIVHHGLAGKTPGRAQYQA